MRELGHATRCEGHRIGFVPTMGALHEGHLSLVRTARAECDRVVVSIFVNPAQFGPGEDFASYPRTFARDRRLAAEAGADVIFAPSAPRMYPRPRMTAIAVPSLQEALCGRTRPGHFDGVCLVVAKLLNLVEPDRLYLGQKDAQQATILTRMITDLNFPVRVRVCRTVREADGLALSSRNQYLTVDERAYAPSLYRSLRAARARVADGERRAAAVRRVLRAGLRAPRALADRVRVDYAEVVDRQDLAPVTSIDRDVLIAVAVHVGRARLIDNVVAKPPRKSIARTRPAGRARRHTP